MNGATVKTVVLKSFEEKGLCKISILNAMDRFIHRAMMAYVLFANMKQLEFYGCFIF